MALVALSLHVVQKNSVLCVAVASSVPLKRNAYTACL
jgi:hypothetical protein